jgi:hypothetical protein
MTIPIGQTLLETLIDDLGLQGISTPLQKALAVRFDQMYDTGPSFFGNNQLAAVLMAVPGTRDALVEVGLDNFIEVGVAIGQAKENAEIPDPSHTAVTIDTGSIAENPVEFDAENKAYDFRDDASKETHVKISNFSADDAISFSNAEVSDYAFANSGEDVWLTYNFNDEGPMNFITLAGIVSDDDLVYDLESFIAAAGFDPFVV